MQIDNPFQLNDWNIKKLINIVVAIQIAMWGLVGLDTIGIQIPILRQFIGFIYLTFIPGILILRILKLHKLEIIETILYTVGLSILTLMFTGFFMNMTYPIFGVSKPISLVPLLITISVVILILLVLSYVIDNDFSEPSIINVETRLYKPVLFLVLVPILTLFSIYLVNYYHNNILLMMVIILIAIIFIFMSWDLFYLKNLYPLAVIIIAQSLLYHYSLISTYIIGADIHIEYYYANLVKLTDIWDPTIVGNINAMLSIVMLAPIFSNICDLNLSWVFKIVYPSLFSLVPLGLYNIYAKQTNDKIAFLSVFYFMAIYTFYVEMTALARQQIAELYFVLVLLLITNKRDKLNGKILLIMFGIGLIVSHYGLSYLIILFCIIGLPFMVFILKYKSNLYNTNFLRFCAVFALSWYIFMTSGSTFETIVNIGHHIYSTIFTETLATQSIKLATSMSTSVCGQTLRVLYLLTQVFIVVGIVNVFIKQKTFKFNKEYFTIAVIYLCVLVASIVTSRTGMNIHRLYHIASIVLAPFCAIGGIIICTTLAKLVNASWSNECVKKGSLKVLSVLFVMFFLFNIEIFQEVVKDGASSIPLSQEWIKESGDEIVKTNYYAQYYPEQDIFGVRWISKNRNNEAEIYADVSHKLLPFVSYGMMLDGHVLTNTTKVKEGSYIYLGSFNVNDGLMSGPEPFEGCWKISNILPLLNEKNIIYSNGGSTIYK